MLKGELVNTISERELLRWAARNHIHLGIHQKRRLRDMVERDILPPRLCISNGKWEFPNVAVKCLRIYKKLMGYPRRKIAEETRPLILADQEKRLRNRQSQKA